MSGAVFLDVDFVVVCGHLPRTRRMAAQAELLPDADSDLGTLARPERSSLATAKGARLSAKPPSVSMNGAE